VAEKLIGGYAVGFVRKAEPYKLFLFRHTNPIEMVYIPDLNIMLFASEKQFLQKAIGDANSLPLGITIVEDECLWKTAANDSIYSFDASPDAELSPVDQFTQEPLSFQSRNYGNTVVVEEDPTQLDDILATLSPEHAAWLTNHIHSTKSRYWTYGFKRARQQAESEMPYHHDRSYMQGYRDCSKHNPKPETVN
jgi:hypothetical protein